MSKKETPSSKEKSALTKALGQKPQPESILDSTKNIQQPDSELSVAELIVDNLKNPVEIRVVNFDLQDLKSRRSLLLVEKREIKSKLKPESRESKKIPGIGKKNSPDRTERKNLRARLKWIDRQLFLINEELEAKEKRLSVLTSSSIKHDEIGLIRDKSNAGYYLRKNKHLIKAKMLKAINDFRKTYDSQTIDKIRTLARSNRPNSLKQFKLEFGEILLEIDEATFILASGLLSDELFTAARFTILSKSPSFRGEIEELVMSAEQ